MEEWERRENAKEALKPENRWLIAQPGDEWMGEFGEPKGAIPKQMYN